MMALWEGVDVGIGHMIVDATSLDVKPIADRLLAEAEGEGPVRVPGGRRAVPGLVGVGDVLHGPLDVEDAVVLRTVRSGRIADEN